MIGKLFIIILLMLGFISTSAQRMSYFTQARIIPDTTIYPGQQLIYQYSLYMLTDLQNPPEYRPPTFDELWNSDVVFNTYETATIDGQAYNVTHINTVLYALSPGQINLEPAQTYFDDGTQVQTEAIQLHVSEFPTVTSVDFSGLTGVFEVYAAVGTTSAAPGDPLAITVTVTGTGNLQRMNRLTLDFPSGLLVYPQPDRLSQSLDQQTLVVRRVFEWLVVPTTSGTFVIGTEPLVYFDSQTETYVDRTFSLPPLQVEEVAVRPTEASAVPPVNPLVVRPVAGLPSDAERTWWQQLFVAALMLPLALTLAGFVLRFIQRHRHLPLNNALRQLPRVKRGNDEEFYKQLELLIQNFIDAMTKDKMDDGDGAYHSTHESASQEEALRELLAYRRRAEAGRFDEGSGNLQSRRELRSKIELALRKAYGTRKNT